MTATLAAKKSETAPAADETISRLVRAIVEEVRPEKIVLFGSRARGTQTPTSDVDLLVIESEPFGPGRSKFEELGRLYERLGGFGIAKDILLYSRDEVEKWRSSINHVVARALREGKVLYARP
ncbi:MAG: nucleotidyltransferase domain-containing protein [Bdellovibrionota bacterium]